MADRLRSFENRVAKLERQVGREENDDSTIFVITYIGKGLAISDEECLEILGEERFLRGRTGLKSVRLYDIPNGLSETELKKYLRKSGGEIVGPTHG